jgi:hypothetical protein
MASIDAKQYSLDLQHRSKKSCTKEQWEKRLRENILTAQEKGCQDIIGEFRLRLDS